MGIHEFRAPPFLVPTETRDRSRNLYRPAFWGQCPRPLLFFRQLKLGRMFGRVGGALGGLDPDPTSPAPSSPNEVQIVGQSQDSPLPLGFSPSLGFSPARLLTGIRKRLRSPPLKWLPRPVPPLRPNERRITSFFTKLSAVDATLQMEAQAIKEAASAFHCD